MSPSVMNKTTMVENAEHENENKEEETEVTDDRPNNISYNIM